jgi:D-glycero-beta-D-manno-heptose-7-phosphate kinase
MIDRYLSGNVTRISPEAPVPVVHFQQTYDRLGGAANVALNIKALGSTPLLCSVVGNDEDGRIFCNMLNELDISNEGIVIDPSRISTVKTRIVGNHQQMLRIDRENTFDLDDFTAKKILEKLYFLMEKYNIGAVILQDYNKGVLTLSVIQEIIAMAQKRGIPVAVDPKKNHFFAYKGVTLFKPNLKEVKDSLPFSIEPNLDALQKASSYLRSQLQNQWTMITLSEKGLFLDAQENGQGQIYPTIPRNIADVSGAGDTVISVAALGLAAGITPEEIAVLSNLAGGQVCERQGVVPVDKNLLIKELEEYYA